MTIREVGYEYFLEPHIITLSKDDNYNFALIYMEYLHLFGKNLNYKINAHLKLIKQQ